MASSPSLFSKIRRGFTLFGGIYALLVLLIALPFGQKHALYAHKVKWPISARFDTPERYGLAPGKVINTQITTSDNLTLGAWFTFSDLYFQEASLSRPGNITMTEVDLAAALKDHITILFFHGNAASRAAPHRVRFYSQWSSRFDANILAIDYRGFADSQGSPSEHGLELDAQAAWDWLIAKGANPNQILLFGQSLGTGVVAKLAYALGQQGVHPLGAVLAGAFTDLATLLETYNISGWIPLLQPFQLIPFFFKALDSILMHKFSTISILPDVSCPILLIHAEDDFDVQIAHSERLFDAILEPYLEQYPFTKEDLSKVRIDEADKRLVIQEISQRRRQQRETKVREQYLPIGKLLSFERQGKAGVHFLRSTWGGHSQVINLEGISDLTRTVFDP
ncbi:hypothetical protein PIIN_04817 [Serendipita indica DSM 11827]|uniref:AB hydrolase-1 domain-containing protein n=1 Tax=Serendipita indica (strain DSM 11827) TaxID=1109443 RepID=G4THT8_SERID|nr:hypothetical protein PIIN_04817 [Serendipita indica DSM 11827]